jgi:aryl-alcohol dehydrogenase-like predicted oxidoreductase
VHPIAALQSEWSLFTRGLEKEIVPTARELGIGIVPYSPIGRGILSGALTSTDDLSPDDLRRANPRYSEENLKHNLELVRQLRELAEEIQATPVQLALRWLLEQGDDVVPIPGTKRVSYLEENVGAADIDITGEQLRRLDELFPPGAVAGERYPEAAMAAVER